MTFYYEFSGEDDVINSGKGDSIYTSVLPSSPNPTLLYTFSTYTAYTYTYKYIPTHVTKFENFRCLKGDKNLRCQLSNDSFQNSNDQFFGGSETHLPYSHTQMTLFKMLFEIQMTLFKMSFESQMRDLNLK